jgi:hypothetical protein
LIRGRKDVDGRDKPGHDEVAGLWGIMTASLTHFVTYFTNQHI